MARTRSATHAGQRAQILARAAELFARHGYPATTMNDVAAACEVSKATLYHYVQDKHALLAEIALDHVQRLQAVTAEVAAEQLPAPQRLRRLIERFMQAYAHAQHEHRVLTDDMQFLRDGDRARVQSGQRAVVAAFADTVAELRPGTAAAGLHTPLAMLLFGMMNWTFTWLRPGGPLTHEALAPIVADLFSGGLPAVRAP